jgi:hypothetical protein
LDIFFHCYHVFVATRWVDKSLNKAFAAREK